MIRKLEILNKLQTQGIVVVEDIKNESDLINLAKSVGRVKLNSNGKAVAKIKSTRGENSLPGTFSKHYGMSKFPLHTDTAFLSIPIRYLVLGMFESSISETTYLHFNELIECSSINLFALARDSIYLLETFEECKYIGAIFGKNSEIGLRFDPNIMKPINTASIQFHTTITDLMNEIVPHKINWTGNKAVVIDNWQVLHGRAEVLDQNREILRIYVEN